MRFSLALLKQYLATQKSPKEICQILDNGGIEVEELSIPTPPNSKGFEIAKIVTAKPIEGTKLKLCKAQSKSGIHSIVCGAANATEGMFAILATLGTRVGDITIAKRKIQGIVSEGMLCSLEELGLAEKHNAPKNNTQKDNPQKHNAQKNNAQKDDGIVSLPPNVKLEDEPFKALLESLTMFEVAITPNRGDCASVYGIAREIAAAGGGKLSMKKLRKIAKTAPPSPMKINIDSPNCSFFGAVLIKGVTNLTSPPSLQQSLAQMGMSSINAAVDITNYFSGAFCRPLHCYDANKIKDIKITEKSSSFEALDGNQYKLTQDTAVESDGKIAALAGVIAMFNKAAVARASRKLNLHTESSYRFERGVDHNEALDMLHEAALQIAHHCGGEVHSPVYEGKTKLPPRRIKLGPKLVERVGGVKLTSSQISQMLQKSGSLIHSHNTLDKTQGILNVEVPSYRHDIREPTVLVSEVLRLRGLDAIKSQPFNHPSQNLDAFTRLEYIAKRAFANRSLQEIVTWSFVPTLFANKAGDKAEGKTEGKTGGDNVEIANPINKEQMAFLRSNLVLNLLEQEADEMFELGPVWLDPSLEQRHIASIRLSTNQNTSQNTLYEAKQDVLHCLEVLGAAPTQLAQTSRALYHPGLSGEFRQNKKAVAYFGMVHPKFQRAANVSKPAFCAEILLDELSLNASLKKEPFQQLKFQPVERDFAFVVSEQVSAGELVDVLLTANQLITAVNVFDVYRGKPLSQNEKSLALKVTIQPQHKTLTSEEIEQITTELVTAATKVKAKLRNE